MKKPLIQLLSKLWRHFSSRRHRQFGGLFILILFTSFAEVMSIGAVLPFLAVLSGPERIFYHPQAHPFMELLGIFSAEQLLLPLTVIFCIATLIAGFMRLLLLWVSTRLSFAAGADLSIDMYRRTLYQSYEKHVARNSSEVISGISGKANAVIYGVITPMLLLVSSTVMLVVILAMLVIIDPFIALTSFGGFGFIYFITITLTRKKLLDNGNLIAKESTNVIKLLQEGLGGIRDVLIDGTQSVYCHVYRNADLQLRRAQGSNLFISQSPRYGMEAVGMLLIAILAYVLGSQFNDIEKAIPILGALALGAQRLLPLLQQAYSSWSTIQAGEASLQDALDLLDQPLPSYLNRSFDAKLCFKDSIKLKNIQFRYGLQMPNVLNDINLKIEKGSRVGFIGTTGCGKSTLLDIIMALLEPTFGELVIDDQHVTSENSRAWQAHIAHVPQTIFLADTTVAENIAFGVPKMEIDFERLKLAAQKAQISSVIESWPDKYQSLVGERGVRLSGGQRQRIGIARALYKKADVVIFDEATSALDGETEAAIMNEIENFNDDLTILIIAHRLTTLKGCQKIIELKNGKVERMGTYEEMIGER